MSRDAALNKPPKYPGGIDFGILLAWHLNSWGTHCNGNDEKNEGLWDLEEFAALIVGSGGSHSPEAPAKSLKNWMTKGKAPPSDKRRVIRILETLFGDKQCFDIWRNDLITAWEAYYHKPLFDNAGNPTQPRTARHNRTKRNGLKENSSRSLASNHLGADGKDFEKNVVAEPKRRVGYGHPQQSSPFRAKIDFLRYNISSSQLAKIGESQDRWFARFEPRMIAEALGYEVRITHPTSTARLVEQWISGTRSMKFSERLKLADHLALTTHARDRSTAAALLADEVTFDRFAHELVASGWATREMFGFGRMRSLPLILEAFKPFGFRAGGLMVGDDATIASTRQGQTRGMGIPLPGDIGELQSISLDAKVGLIVEQIAKPRGLLVLEIGPMQHDGNHSITSLIPSVMAPSCNVMPGQMLPTREVNGVSRFIAKEPIGRYDWLAILTLQPLSPIWQQTEHEFHRLSEVELGWLIDALEEQTHDAECVSALEVRHHAFRIKGKAG